VIQVGITPTLCIKWVSSGDAGEPDFKEFSGIVKEEKTAISTSLSELLGRRGETGAML